MEIPVKITPDRIRDSIVQVYFQAGIPFEPLIGIFYAALTNAGWKYANRAQSQVPQKGMIIELSTGRQYFFIKDQVRLQLFPNQSLAFNCINSYIGWQRYRSYIGSVFTELSKTGYFTNYFQAGIRYISEFANIDILEKINFKAETSFNDENISNSSYRLTFEKDNIFKTINIASKLPVNAVLANQKEPLSFTSLLDVDIVQKKLSCKNVDELLINLDQLHTIEKKTFFRLLTDEFLQTLNPEYA